MNNPDWDEFRSLAEAEVRKRLASHVYSEHRERQARQWLEYGNLSDSSASRRHTLAIAKEANDLARSANEAASELNVIARRAAD